MSAIDDILYAPIAPAASDDADIDQSLIAQIELCLRDPNVGMTWMVNPSTTIATYNRIAKIIEENRPIFRAARNFCASDPWGNFRPQHALTIQQLFSSFHVNPTSTEPYFWTARGSTQGVVEVTICNTFTILRGMPMVRLTDGLNYEWWMVGLMSKFAGYQGYYFFPHKMYADNYWKLP